MTINRLVYQTPEYYSRNIVIDKVEANNVIRTSFIFDIFMFAGTGMISEYNINLNNGNHNPRLIESVLSSGIDCSSFNPSFDLLKIENLNKLRMMSKFESDWNGNNAKPFTKASIQLFDKLINSLNRQPKIAPTGNESLLVQYEKNDKSLLAFDVSLKKTRMVFVPEGNYDEAEEKTFTDNVISTIQTEVERFYEVR
ncbi:MAG: hypothetical protein IJ058_01765 [Lachnospiraceae bacterium]|nr:hypothetical protein [Lachnospiraceae bacterium]